MVEGHEYHLGGGATIEFSFNWDDEDRVLVTYMEPGRNGVTERYSLSKLRWLLDDRSMYIARILLPEDVRLDIIEILEDYMYG